MLRYNTMATDSDEIKLTVGIDNKDKFYMPCIEFTNVMDKEHKDQFIMWDNEDFIWGEFYEFLQRFSKNELRSEDKFEYADIWSELNLDVVKQLLEILDKAKQLGWYEKI